MPRNVVSLLWCHLIIKMAFTQWMLSKCQRRKYTHFILFSKDHHHHHHHHHHYHHCYFCHHYCYHYYYYRHYHHDYHNYHHYYIHGCLPASVCIYLYVRMLWQNTKKTELKYVYRVTVSYHLKCTMDYIVKMNINDQTYVISLSQYKHTLLLYKINWPWNVLFFERCPRKCEYTEFIAQISMHCIHFNEQLGMGWKNRIPAWNPS